MKWVNLILRIGLGLMLLMFGLNKFFWFMPDFDFTGYPEADHLFKAFFPYSHVVDHKKYGNNYDYNKAVYLMNREELIENGFLLLKEETAIHSPLAVLFYERYKDEDNLRASLENKKEEIQCIVSLKDVPFGKAQHPALHDYADGIDTMEFLTTLK